MTSMKKWLIEKLGGYPDFDSALNAVKRMDDVASKNALLSEAVKHLFNAIGPDDVLQRKNGKWMFQGKPITDAEYENLCAEAQSLLGMKIWRVLKMDIRYQLNRKMFEEANITMDVIWGKLILYLDDIVRTRLQSMK